MKNNKKMSNGITLIALVVTIIVLLILAGISIQMLTGNNGILQRATEAKEKTEESQIIEDAKMNIINFHVNKGRKNFYWNEAKCCIWPNLDFIPIWNCRFSSRSRKNDKK